MYLRRNGHLYESQAPSAGSHYMDGSYYGEQQPFAEFTDPWASGAAHHAPTGGGSSWFNDSDAYGWPEDDDTEDQDNTFDWFTDATLFAGYEEMTTNEAGECIYLEYRKAKARWDRFRGHRSGKGFKRSGKGYGSFGGFGRGKGGKNAGGYRFPTHYEGHYEHEDQDVWSNYFKGGKSGGKSRQGNPRGRDGEVLKCSICESEEHLRARCPQRQAAPGDGAPTFATAAAAPGAVRGATGAAPPQTSARSASSSNNSRWTSLPPAVRRDYFGSMEPVPEPSKKDSDLDSLAEWYLQDGSVIEVDVDEADRRRSSVEHDSDPLEVHLSCSSKSHMTMDLFPWWVPQSLNSDVVQVDGEAGSSSSGQAAVAYHAQTRRKGKEREGLLVDPGAKDNLTGRSWVNRMMEIARKHGKEQILEERPLEGGGLSVEGVGTSAQKCTVQAAVPICLADGSCGRYVAPIIENSEVPALLGNKVLREKKGLLDCHNGRLMLVGKGGYHVRLSPGSRVYELEESESEHWLLPCTEWHKRSAESGTGRNPSPLRRVTLNTNAEVIPTQIQEEEQEPDPGDRQGSRDRL